MKTNVVVNVIEKCGETIAPDENEAGCGIVSKRRIILGNVEFWIDNGGPWNGEVSYSLIRELWDIPAVVADIERVVKAYNAQEVLAQ